MSSKQSKTCSEGWKSIFLEKEKKLKILRNFMIDEDPMRPWLGLIFPYKVIWESVFEPPMDKYIFCQWSLLDLLKFNRKKYIFWTCKNFRVEVSKINKSPQKNLIEQTANCVFLGASAPSKSHFWLILLFNNNLQQFF